MIRSIILAFGLSFMASFAVTAFAAEEEGAHLTLTVSYETLTDCEDKGHAFAQAVSNNLKLPLTVRCGSSGLVMQPMPIEAEAEVEVEEDVEETSEPEDDSAE